MATMDVTRDGKVVGNVEVKGEPIMWYLCKKCKKWILSDTLLREKRLPSGCGKCKSKEYYRERK